MHLQPIPAMHVHTSTRNLQKLSDLPCSSTGHCHSVPPRWPDHPVFRTAPQIWCRQSHRHQALRHSTGRADRISCAWVSRALALPSLLCMHHTRLVYCCHVSLTPSSPDCHVSPSSSPRLLENIYIFGSKIFNPVQRVRTRSPHSGQAVFNRPMGFRSFRPKLNQSTCQLGSTTRFIGSIIWFCQLDLPIQTVSIQVIRPDSILVSNQVIGVQTGSIHATPTRSKTGSNRVIWVQVRIINPV
jgi:hypothetical protein